MQRRRLLELAAATGAGLGAWRNAQAAVQDETWRDQRRERDVPVRLRWPAGDGPCALIVHSHGLGGSRDGADAWGHAWQQAGFAVLHLQHPGSDTDVLRALRALRAAASAEQLRARVADMQFAVDEIARRAHESAGPPQARVPERAPGWSRVRHDALGASGHSFGAVTVQALAGQRFALPTPGNSEPRFKAFVAFSPSPGQGLPAGEAFAGLTRPFLAVTGSLDSDVLGRGLTAEDRTRVYDSLPPGQRALLWLEGADHMTFGGNAEPRLRARFGPLKRERVAAENEVLHHERVAAITTLWWRAKLLGDAQAIAALRAPVGLGEGDRWRQD